MSRLSGGLFTNTFKTMAENEGFNEIILPSLEPAEIYKEKIGPEVLGQMYVFPDKKDRQLCLRPEGTATCQLLARGPWQSQKDVKIWYETRCWRYERPQAGRYREFTQLGLEVLNPRRDYRPDLLALLRAYLDVFGATLKYELVPDVKRGLAYYVEDGFEAVCPELGAQKQIAGGGRYKEGIGFAIGLDRLTLAIGPKVEVK